ncbi:uncharacterized protein LOC107009859 [Solanum pennellii]|uniref:Uncharacterized protein LOC107009859 n=1 Tax=Solanum pennellii TaxID=28526 RepID=A0ABM1G1L7_SOLPN|nr:uncharacterized protein LOC107009859 [Solanum pennellii]
MTFGLKNVGATYMRAMTTIFHDIFHKEIEVYVDDVIIKSSDSSYHLTHLKKFFDRLRRYNLKLNPAKCAFEVPVGKLLGFIDSKRAQSLADHLAKNPVDEEYEPLKTNFHDEEVSFVGEDISEMYHGWRLFFDGAANHHGKGMRAVLVLESGQHYPIAAKLRFNCTNNMAEYEACILGLRIAIDMNMKELLYVQKLCKRFHKIEFRHTPRIKNELADALAIITSMIKHPDTDCIDPLDIELKEHPVHCSHVEAKLGGLPWYFDIKKYLECGIYPEDATSN